MIATDDDELGRQLGRQVQQLTKESGISPSAALDEVTETTKDALAGGKPLDKNALHEELRARVRPELMPWCRGCKSHHVAPMLWRFATVKAGARLDSDRRYRKGKRAKVPPASEAVRRFLTFYGPNTAAGFAEWAGLAKTHAQRLWEAVEVEEGLLPEDVAALESPPQADGVRLLPPGDPYLQKPNRPLLAPGDDLRKRLFRPVASPGAVLKDGRLAGLWRARKGVVTVEKLGRLKRTDVEDEAQRVIAPETTVELL